MVALESEHIKETPATKLDWLTWVFVPELL